MRNRQEVIGHLGGDAQIISCANERCLIKFTIYANHHKRDANGNVVDHSEKFNIKLFTSHDAAYKYFAPRLVRGSLAFIEGTTITETYIDNTGQERESRCVECEPHNVKPLSKPEPAAEPRPASQTEPQTIHTHNAYAGKSHQRPHTPHEVRPHAYQERTAPLPEQALQPMANHRQVPQQTSSTSVHQPSQNQQQQHQGSRPNLLDF